MGFVYDQEIDFGKEFIDHIPFGLMPKGTTGKEGLRIENSASVIAFVCHIT